MIEIRLEEVREGWKFFNGTIRVTPKNDVPPFEIATVWIYKPEYGCWYGDGQSFPEEICEKLTPYGHHI